MLNRIATKSQRSIGKITYTITALTIALIMRSNADGNITMTVNQELRHISFSGSDHGIPRPALGSDVVAWGDDDGIENYRFDITGALGTDGTSTSARITKFSLGSFLIRLEAYGTYRHIYGIEATNISYAEEESSFVDSFEKYASIVKEMRVSSGSNYKPLQVVFTPDPALPTHTVTFDLGTYGTRVGGGQLEQSIIDRFPAQAPWIRANPGWIFRGWNMPFNNITSSQTITAKFEIDIVDSDNDLMDDNWERNYFNGNLQASNGLKDSDYDGLSDLDEFITGNDPTDGADFFKIIKMPHIADNGNISLEFTSNNNHPARHYRIYYSEDLSVNSWNELLATPIFPESGETTVQEITLPFTASNNKVFFRVNCFLQQPNLQ